METATIAPVIYIPHGGGPLPLLGDPAHRQLVDFLTNIPRSLGAPAAIILISAHWEEQLPTITGGIAPDLLYDYHGFPPKSYQIKYPAPGAPVLAKRLQALLADAGLQSRLDDQRDFDHGLFIPLKIMFPRADIPCIQLSLLASLDPKAHIAIGKALAPLRQENILIIGSGFSFHNLSAFFTNTSGATDQQNDAFSQWLIDTCTSDILSSREREERLTHWTNAPNARYCHPREEHLLPLHICAGITGTRAKLVFDGEVFGKRTCAFLW